jgi:hypothetical protein
MSNTVNPETVALAAVHKMAKEQGWANFTVTAAENGFDIKQGTRLLASVVYTQKTGTLRMRSANSKNVLATESIAA